MRFADAAALATAAERRRTPSASINIAKRSSQALAHIVVCAIVGDGRAAAAAAAVAIARETRLFLLSERGGQHLWTIDIEKYIS